MNSKTKHDLQENRRYRLDRREKKRLKKQHHTPPSGERAQENNPPIHTDRRREFNFVQVSLEILKSMTSWQSKAMIKRIARQLSADTENAKHGIVSVVFWPNLWDGVWKQFSIDLPRERLIYQQVRWEDPFALFWTLEKNLGPIWSRWVCVFSNQAPMSDVVSSVSKEIEKEFGSSVILSDNKDPLTIHIHHPDGDDDNRSSSLSLQILKNFAVTLTHSMEKVATVHTEYIIQFYPQCSATLLWHNGK